MDRKVCFVSTTSITMKCFIIPIARELIEAGVDVTLVCSDDDSMYSLCAENGFKYHPIHMGRGIDKSGIKAIREIKKLLKTERFDLVQYCTPNAACYASIAAKLAKIPTRIYCQWGIRYVGLSGISRKVFKIIEKMICSLSTDIRAVSWKNKEFAVSEGLYKVDKARIVGNGGTIGVDMTLFDVRNRAALCAEIRNRLNIADNDFVFGFCGRLSRDKGSNELLAAFKAISASYNNVRLLVIGDIEVNAETNDHLFAWAKNSNTVIFTGKISEEEVFQYYAPMNVLVHPTYREGFGMVIQEAGAYGIPCITTNIPGASEVMEDGKSCLLVEAHNARALEKSMIKVLHDKRLLDQLGHEAYIRTKKLYDRSIMLRYQTQDYLELLSNR